MFIKHLTLFVFCSHVVYLLLWQQSAAYTIYVAYTCVPCQAKGVIRSRPLNLKTTCLRLGPTAAAGFTGEERRRRRPSSPLVLAALASFPRQRAPRTAREHLAIRQLPAGRPCGTTTCSSSGSSTAGRVRAEADPGTHPCRAQGCPGSRTHGRQEVRAVEGRGAAGPKPRWLAVPSRACGAAEPPHEPRSVPPT